MRGLIAILLSTITSRAGLWPVSKASPAGKLFDKTQPMTHLNL